MADGPRAGDKNTALAFGIAAEPFDEDDAASVHLTADRRPRQGAGAVQVRAHGGHNADVAAGAAGGTLFLDEIGDLPIDVQPKLLRFLELQEIMPIGETRPQRVDVRVLAATNADLEQRVAEGKFREDLYYRLSVIRLHVPPLRERLEEIPHLSAFFLREACERLAKPDVQLSSEALDMFSQYWWPGNVRQLKNEIQRAVAMSAPGGIIEAPHLSPEIGATRLPATASSPSSRRAPRAAANLATAIEEVERELIQAALNGSSGNISQAARVLGLTRRGLYLKLRRLGLDAPAEVG